MRFKSNRIAAAGPTLPRGSLIQPQQRRSRPARKAAKSAGQIAHDRHMIQVRKEAKAALAAEAQRERRQAAAKAVWDRVFTGHGWAV